MDARTDKPALAVIVANWNGEAFIERCLGSVLAATRRTRRPIEVIVYDDASQDRSPEIVARRFPTIRLIRGARNVGYGAAVNYAMHETHADWIFLLNNDLALAADFCERLLATLEAQGEAATFAIGALTRDWEGGAVNHGGQRATWRRGMLVQSPFEAEQCAPADFIQAGACLIDRKKFLELGGFSPLYYPGYWEDYDLSWQARRRGWGVWHEPAALAWHLGRGSMRRRLGAHGVALALRRNHLLFNWLNLPGPSQLCLHFLGLGRLVALDRTLPEEVGWGRALSSALGRLPAVLAERRRRRRQRPPIPSA